ncbi:MAG: transcriptional regulator [Saprospiraceae bacterium]|nr:transcriptional regulator [Saprospiraceae bacterium]
MHWFLSSNTTSGLLAALSACFLLGACQLNTPNQNTAPQEPEYRTYEELAAGGDAGAQLNLLGDSVFERGEYPAAIAFYQRSMDSAAVQADSFVYYDSKLDLASVHDRLGEPQQAIDLALPVVEAFIRSGDSSRIGRTYAALAGFYGKANMPDKSWEATQKGFAIVKQYGDSIHRCAAYNQMAFFYSDQGRWDLALPLLDTALQLLEASGILNQRPGMRLNLGDCHRQLGHWAEARRYLSAAAAEADSLGQAHVYARALERLSELAEANNNPGLALQLFRQADTIRDSMFTGEKTRNLQALEVEFQTREKEQEIRLLRAEKAAQEARQYLLLVGLCFLGLVAGLVGYILWAKLRSAGQRLEQHQQDLREYTQLLLTKNTRLTELEQALQQLENTDTGPDNETAFSNEQAESLYNNKILTDTDWDAFKHHFERSHPGYLLRLRTQYPDLSGAEERLLLLIKTGLNSQEVANTLGITLNAIKKGRQRLRKRIGLQAETDLEQFVRTTLG